MITEPTKRCPDCIWVKMLLFDGEGRNETYTAIGRGKDVEDDRRIDWGSWPFADAPPANTWVCPQCGYHEEAGDDVLAQQENRPRLFE